MTFDRIIGHERQKDFLRRTLANNRLAHAYLFEGPPGIGKRLTALALARAGADVAVTDITQEKSASSYSLGLTSGIEVKT